MTNFRIKLDLWWHNLMNKVWWLPEEDKQAYTGFALDQQAMREALACLLTYSDGNGDKSQTNRAISLLRKALNESN